MKKRKITLIEVRQRLRDMAFDAGGVVALAEREELSHSNLYRLLRGEGKPGQKTMELLDIRPLEVDKDKPPVYEDIRN